MPPTKPSAKLSAPDWACQRSREPSPVPCPSVTFLCPSDLVEKVPCSWNSSRMCECRPGMFCKTSAAYSCARCQPHSPCSEGKVITALGECVHSLRALPQEPPAGWGLPSLPGSQASGLEGPERAPGWRLRPGAVV